METSEMIVMVKALTDEKDEEVISAFLSLAVKALKHHADPFDTITDDEFIAKYPDVIVDAAAYKINKRGWDYQVTYTENGVRREYESGDLPSSILKRITPVCGAVK